MRVNLFNTKRQYISVCVFHTLVQVLRMLRGTALILCIEVVELSHHQHFGKLYAMVAHQCSAGSIWLVQM